VTAVDQAEVELAWKEHDSFTIPSWLHHLWSRPKPLFSFHDGRPLLLTDWIRRRGG
jgi:gentisate 1,2-dioxygenase